MMYYGGKTFLSEERFELDGNGRKRLNINLGLVIFLCLTDEIAGCGQV